LRPQTPPLLLLRVQQRAVLRVQAVAGLGPGLRLGLGLGLGLRLGLGLGPVRVLE
jgi:hypothetical protein